MRNNPFPAVILFFALLMSLSLSARAEDVSFYAEQEVDKGWQAFEEGNLNAAVQSFRQATVVDPEYAPAYYALGHADLARNQLGGAIANFKKAIELADPPMIEAYINLGFALTLAGRDREGLQTYNEALALAPQNRELHLNLANYYCSQLDGKKAWEHIRFVQELDGEISEELLEEMRSLCPEEE